MLLKKKFSSLYPLSNIKITKCKPKFNGVFSRDNLPRKKR